VLDAKTSDASLPEGVRLYAIGDVHGRLDLLRTLIEAIEARERAAQPARLKLVFLGDYIDRGPDSAGVIAFLIDGLPERFEPVFLKGNHEEMLLDIFTAPDGFDIWAYNGGLATARSYGVDFDPYDFSPDNANAVARQLERAMPEAHMTFLRQLNVSKEIGDYFFVHAGVRPGVPLDQQNERDCLFIRGEFLDHRASFGKVIVHGHTPVEAPEILPNRIGIDTGAFFTGRLTALCLESGSMTLLTTETDGRVGTQPV